MPICLLVPFPDSQIAIKKHKKLDSILIPETGTFVSDDVSTNKFFSDNLEVIWVGKFDFRKQLSLAISALAATYNKKIILNIYGEGSKNQIEHLEQLAIDLNISNQIVWHGNQPNATVQKAMREAHLFFFTSVSEDTSTVVLEAISNRLPVLCFNTCGFGAIINNNVGRKVTLTNPQKSIIDFAEYLNIFYEDRVLLEKLSQNCKTLQQRLSWDEKAKKVVELYERIKK